MNAVCLPFKTIKAARFGLLFVVLKCRVCEIFRTFRFSRFLHVSFFKSSTFRFAGFKVADPFHNTVEIEDHLKRHFGESINISLCMHDISLLIAYPAFERLSLYARYTPTNKFSGYFNPLSYGMMICMGTLNSPFQYQTEGVLLHEVQHLIQEEEDFARGGNLSQGRKWYLRMAGEVEARNVCIRHSMSSEQRRSSLRTDTQDVPDAEQIIKLL